MVACDPLALLVVEDRDTALETAIAKGLLEVGLPEGGRRSQSH